MEGLRVEKIMKKYTLKWFGASFIQKIESRYNHCQNNQEKLYQNMGNFSFLFFSVFLLVSTKGMLLGYDSMNFWDFPGLS